MKRGTVFLILATCLLKLCLVSVAASQQQASETKPNASECTWLLSNLDSARPISVGQNALFVLPETARKLDEMRAQIAGLSSPGVVVYAPVIAEGSITMMRMESQATGHSPLLDAHKTSWNEQTFRTALAAAQQPGGDFFSRDLHRQLLASFAEKDLGKSIFIFDPEAYGIAPQALGLKDSLVIGSSNFETSLANLSRLKNTRFKASDFAAILGLPSDSSEYHAVFTNSMFGDLAEWQSYNRKANEVAAGYGVTVLSGNGAAAPLSKSDLMKKMEEQAGIVLIIAHAEGARILLPGSGQPIDLSPSDIGGLHLKAKPFVVLRVCQGDDQGFANAFIHAGAVGVWSNRGVISADTAIEQVRMFLDSLRAGKSALDAISEVLSHNPAAAANATLFAETHSGLDGAPHGDNGRSSATSNRYTR